jgi:hypothetical protein
MNKRIKNFGFLLFPDLEELDLVGFDGQGNFSNNPLCKLD